jgi:hypothetical protein
VSEVRHRIGKHLRVLAFRSDLDDEIDETLDQVRGESGDIDRFCTFDPLLHQLIDVAVQTLGHDVAPSHTENAPAGGGYRGSGDNAEPANIFASAAAKIGAGVGLV